MNTQQEQRYKVLITTSGLGSRLASETAKKNKSLVEINHIPILSYIIDSYPKDIEFVITLGYLGDQVKEYIQKQYTDRHVIYVTVDRFTGEGSSLAYSMLQAKSYLQVPFIFHCNDSLIFDSIPSPVYYNWNGGSKGVNNSLYTSKYYSSFTTNGSQIVAIYPKGNKEHNYLHIGLVGIKDFDAFWLSLENAYKVSPNDQTLNDIVAINDMIKNGYSFRAVMFPKWLDTGNLRSLQLARDAVKKGFDRGVL